MSVKFVASIVALFAGLSAPVQGQPSTTPVKAMKITVLSTMLAGNPGEGVGEWGFAALLEADGQRWLIDTGAQDGSPQCDELKASNTMIRARRESLARPRRERASVSSSARSSGDSVKGVVVSTQHTATLQMISTVH